MEEKTVFVTALGSIPDQYLERLCLDALEYQKRQVRENGAARFVTDFNLYGLPTSRLKRPLRYASILNWPDRETYYAALLGDMAHAHVFGWTENPAQLVFLEGFRALCSQRSVPYEVTLYP